MFSRDITDKQNVGADPPEWPELLELPDPRPQLVAHARAFYERGWMWGTAGNLSARLPDGSFWITASGCSKGELTPQQFVQMSANGACLSALASAKPSAENSIHQAIYQRFPEAQACYHVHSVAANLVSEFSMGDQIRLPAIEMLKGLGVWEEHPTVYLEIFPNHAHVPQIAQAIDNRFQSQLPHIPACLVRGHGTTVWGSTPEETRNRVEVLEFMMQYLVAAQSLGERIPN
jgi:methylthioribulose-1-phosphate dehydratase